MWRFSSLFEYKPEIQFTHYWDAKKFFFIDTETTWTNRNKDRILQFAWTYQYWSTNYQKKEFNEYLYIEWDIPEEASKIHWISKKDIENCKPISEYIDERIKIIHECDYVIWYNVEFDLRMLFHEANLIDKNKWDIEDLEQILNKKTIDLMKTSAELVNWPHWKWPKLTELYEYLFKGRLSWAHDASKDVEATEYCFYRLNTYYKVLRPFFAPKRIYGWSFSNNYSSLELNEHWDNLDFNKDNFRAVLDSWNWRYLQYMTDKQMEYYIERDKKNHKYHNDTNRNLNLPCLSGITYKQAKMLSNYSEIRHYDLSGIEYLSKSQALELSKPIITDKNKSMNLDWLSFISDKQAIIYFEECFPRVSARWLLSLTNKQYEILIKQYGSYDLPNLKYLSDEQIEFLDKIYENHKFTIYVWDNLMRPYRNRIWTKWLQKSELKCNYYAWWFSYIAPYPKLKE